MVLAVWLVALALSVVARCATALVCEQTGANAPDVVTLMASKTNPAFDSWIVAPSCSVEVESLPMSRIYISERNDVERIDSLPMETTGLSIPAFPLSRGADLSKTSKISSVKIPRLAGIVLPSTLLNLDVSGSSLSSVAGIVLPASIVELDFSSTQLTSLKDFKLPAKVTTLTLAKSKLSAVDFTITSLVNTLDLGSTPLRSLKGVAFPASLTWVRLSGTQITEIDFEIPSQLQFLDISSTATTKIDRVRFPDSFKILKCDSCGLTTVRGVKWPRAMKSLTLEGNAITNFEIRKSDLGIFKAMAPYMFLGDIIQPTCADSTAQRVVVGSKQLCVISDDRFEAVYVKGNGVTPDAPANAGTSADPIAGSSSEVVTSTGSGTGSGMAAGRDSNGSTPEDPTWPRGSIKDTANSLSGSENSATSSSSHGPSKSPRSIKPGTTSRSTELVTNSASRSPALVIGVACGAAVVLMAVVGLCGFVTKRRRESMSDKYSSLRAPHVPGTNQPSLAFDDLYLINDVRNDKALVPYRIEQRNLIKGEQIATNKESVVYMAIFQGQDVVVKQLSPGSCEDKRKLSRFMDEIRAGASLEHHKIVAFIGIAWSSVRDLSVVMEFMPLGDLGTLLLNHQNPPTAQDWMRPWSSSNVKGKAAIAQDVAEAVVYLHSFNNPILHRNLKARNVLLDRQGNAKLSGFGISRESSLDDTMTGEIGTAAWAAPEILRGERYDEKVDVYSLGVLLVEMDRCQHPYPNNFSLLVQATVVEQRTNTAPPTPRESPGVAYNNTQIAVLVSSGKLRPSVSSECPEKVASLVAKCLSFDPADRPTSMAVHYGLRQARKALERIIC